MSVKELRDGIEANNVSFGIKQAIKGGKNGVVFIAKDSRDETVSKLEEAELEFSVLKNKEEMAKELNLDFESEVFSLKK